MFHYKGRLCKGCGCKLTASYVRAMDGDYCTWICRDVFLAGDDQQAISDLMRDYMGSYRAPLQS